MLSKATFNVAKSDVYHDAALLGTEFQKKKGAIPFSLLLSMLASVVGGLVS